MKSYIFYFLFTINCFNVVAQNGKLMLVGGGSEKTESWGWSNEPYQWAVNNAHNKTVAIIATAESSDPNWLPNYFISLGATQAENFIIDSESIANDINTFNALSQYGVLFFKGGDQSQYYTIYKNSQVTNAIQTVYNSGGVIAGTSAGMAILSEVIYTAEKSSVYPDQILENINHENITLKNDFLQLLPGYLTDTHFIERGRFARLIGFLGNWSINQGENLSGIGVDDRTAFCIDQNVGTVFGTGAVSIYSISNFSHDNQKPISNAVNAIQLIHGQQYHLNNHEQITSYSNESSAVIESENLNFNLFLTGGDQLAKNEEVISKWINNYNEDVIVISRNNSGKASSYISHIENNSGNKVYHINTNINDDCDHIELRRLIPGISHYLFIDNNFQELKSFLENDKTGQMIKEFVTYNNQSILMVGEDSKFSGAYFANNTEADQYTSYYGELEFEEGLGFLKSSLVMPNPYDVSSSDFYENKVSAVPYGLIKYRLKYGIYVNSNSYIHVYQNDSKNYIDSHGQYSSILLNNNSSFAAEVDQVVNSSGNNRNIYGFDQMNYSLLSNSAEMIGEPLVVALPEFKGELLSPSNFEISTIEENQIQLSWDINESAAEEIIIERKIGQGDFSVVASLSISENRYADNVSEDGEYSYRIAFKNSESQSCYTEELKTSILTSLYDESASLKLFPNPIAKGFLNISGLHEEKQAITVYDINGRIHFNEEVISSSPQINLSNLTNGIYFLEIRNKTASIKKKLIINKNH